MLGLLFNLFFFDQLAGLAVPLYIVLILAGLFGIAHVAKRQVSRTAVWLTLPLLFFGSMVAVRSSEFLTFLNVVMSCVLLLIIAKTAFGKPFSSFSVRDYLQTALLPFKFINPMLDTLARIPKLVPIPKDKQVISQILKGVFITIPVLIVLLLLLSSADLVFQKYIQDLVQLNIAPETIPRTVLVVIAALAFVGTYTYIFSKSAQTAVPEETARKSFLGRVEGSILLGSVNALFLLFILIQVAYLFGGQSNITGQGFTYAEYARKGFFELIAVAIISFALVWIMEHHTAKQAGVHPPFFKALSSALIVQVIIIMASAFKRLWLYEEAYGFTVLRFYSHAFTVVLAVVFVLLLYKVLKDGRENVFAFRVFITVVLALAALNLCNPDALIARRNVDRFAATGKLDAYYLASLSDDAVPETVKALDISDKKVAKNVALELGLRRDARLDARHETGWQSWNWSRHNAQKLLDAKASKLEPSQRVE